MEHCRPESCGRGQFAVVFWYFPSGLKTQAGRGHRIEALVAVLNRDEECLGAASDVMSCDGGDETAGTQGLGRFHYPDGRSIQ